jgi:hypothetical protein
MSLGLGQTAFLEPVVEAAVDVGVRALAETMAGPTSETTRVLSPSDSAWSVVISCSDWYVHSICLHEFCRCELALDEDSQTTFETN